MNLGVWLGLRLEEKFEGDGVGWMATVVTRIDYGEAEVGLGAVGLWLRWGFTVVVTGD